MIIIIIKKVQMFHWRYSNAKAFNKVQSQRQSVQGTEDKVKIDLQS